MRIWVDVDVDPREFPDSLPGVMWHVSDAWARRAEPNVVLAHYDDLRRDLEGEIGWTLEDNHLVNRAIESMDGFLDRVYRVMGMTL